MRQKFAALEGGLAALHSFDEAVFLGEVAGDDILDDVAEIAAVFVGTLPETGLKIGSEVDIHGLTIRKSLG